MTKLRNKLRSSTSVGVGDDANRGETGVLESLPVEIARHRILTTGDAAAFWGVSVVQWRRMYRQNCIPPPIRISTRKLGWRVGDLVDALASRAAVQEAR